MIDLFSDYPIEEEPYRIYTSSRFGSYSYETLEDAEEDWRDFINDMKKHPSAFTSDYQIWMVHVDKYGEEEEIKRISLNDVLSNADTSDPDKLDMFELYRSSSGYVLYETETDDNLYRYSIVAPTGDIIKTFTSGTDLSSLTMVNMMKHKLVKSIFLPTISQHAANVNNKKSAARAAANAKPSGKSYWGSTRTPETPYDSGSRNWGGYSPSYSVSKEEALKKYGKSNTLCFHKTDPTTTMLEQIYHDRGWDVVNNAYEMSSETIAALIDAHERIVMLGHGSSGGLIGFINSSHAKNLEPKKLFALWCNADAYCRQNLPDKKGFFACGNMPSDEHEASWQGFEVSHKYMDDNITYWCKLCGDVVEQCLEGDADAGCQYIREKYWERYHKGTADEVGITKYNYVRTKVAGQDNLPEPEGEEIEGPKETVRQLRAKEYRDYNHDHSSRSTTPIAKYEWDDDVKNGDKVFETSTGMYCIIEDSSTYWTCKLFDQNSEEINKCIFGKIAKNGQNIYDKFVSLMGKDSIGELIQK